MAKMTIFVYFTKREKFMKSSLVLNAIAKEHVDHKKNTNLRVFMNRLHSDFPPHWHADIEIIIPIEAPYKVKCGNQTYNVEIGDILFICPAVLHEIFSPAPGGRLYIQADFSGFASLMELKGAFRLLSPALHIKKNSCPPEIYNQFRSYIDSIAKLYFGYVPSIDSNDDEDDKTTSVNELEPYNELEIYSHLMMFIAFCGKKQELFKRTAAASFANSFKNTIPLSDVCAYISEHFTEELTLDRVAEYAGFSKYHFERIFTEYNGVTFYRYIQQMRINYAQTLLSNHDLTITDIAGLTGFTSCTAFTRAFKKNTGYPPSEYRMLKQEQYPLAANKHFANFKPQK